MLQEPLRPEAINAAIISGINFRPIRVSEKTLWGFVELQTSDGLSGVGEATFFRGTHDFPKVTAAFAKRLLGKSLSVLDQPDIVPAEDDITGWAVLSALEQCSWDVYGKAVGQPVHALLGKVVNRQVPIYANINRRTTDRTPAGFVQSVRKAQAEGYSRLKIAPFDGMSPHQQDDDALFQASLDRIRAAQGALNGQSTLLVDCHWRLDMPRALKLLDLSADLMIGWIECPLPESADTIAQLRQFKALCNQAGIAVAGGEQGTSHDYFRRILGEGVYDVIMPDVKYVGGIRQLLRIASLAEIHGVTFSPHNPSGPVAHLASLHAMMVTPNLAMLEHQFDEDPLFWTLNALPMPQIKNALSDPPVLHGLGFSTANFAD